MVKKKEKRKGKWNFRTLVATRFRRRRGLKGKAWITSRTRAREERAAQSKIGTATFRARTERAARTQSGMGKEEGLRRNLIQSFFGFKKGITTFKEFISKKRNRHRAKHGPDLKRRLKGNARIKTRPRSRFGTTLKKLAARRAKNRRARKRNNKLRDSIRNAVGKEAAQQSVRTRLARKKRRQEGVNNDTSLQDGLTKSAYRKHGRTYQRKTYQPFRASVASRAQKASYRKGAHIIKQQRRQQQKSDRAAAAAAEKDAAASAAAPVAARL